MSRSSKASHVPWAADSIFQLSLRKQLASRKVTLCQCIRDSFCMSIGCVLCHFTFIAALLQLWCKFYDPEGSNRLGTLSDIFSPISQATFWQNKAKPARSKKDWRVSAVVLVWFVSEGWSPPAGLVKDFLELHAQNTLWPSLGSHFPKLGHI